MCPVWRKREIVYNAFVGGAARWIPYRSALLNVDGTLGESANDLHKIISTLGPEKSQLTVTYDAAVYRMRKL